ncbi:MAG: hypothetical protein ABUK01_03230 [Leptospirales bacterium]
MSHFMKTVTKTIIITILAMGINMSTFGIDAKEFKKFWSGIDQSKIADIFISGPSDQFLGALKYSDTLKFEITEKSLLIISPQEKIRTLINLDDIISVSYREKGNGKGILALRIN